MTIYIVCPESLEREVRTAYRASKDGEILGTPVIYTAFDGLTYLSWGSSRITAEEARDLSKKVSGVEFYKDEMPMAYFRKEPESDDESSDIKPTIKE